MNLTLMMSIGFTVLVGGIIIWIFRSRMNTLNNKLATLFNFVQNETQRSREVATSHNAEEHDDDVSQENTKIIVSSDSDSEEDDTTDDESDDGEEDDGEEDDGEEPQLKQVELSLDRKVDNEERDDENTLDTIEEITTFDTIKIDEPPSFPDDWRRLNLIDLKALATQFSICENPSKYKKKELQDIISEWENDKSAPVSLDVSNETTNDDDDDTPTPPRSMDLTDVEM